MLFIEISNNVQLTIRLANMPSTEPTILDRIKVNVELKYLKVFI